MIPSPSPRTSPGSACFVGPQVEILAATKYVEAADLPALREAGVALVGENRTDALIPKQEQYGALSRGTSSGMCRAARCATWLGASA